MELAFCRLGMVIATEMNGDSPARRAVQFHLLRQTGQRLVECLIVP